MAANTNKRIPVKHFRDGAKARYPSKVACAICDTAEDLELHHYHGFTNLVEKWQRETGISLKTDEEVLAVRDRFIAEHEYELYTAVVCLCVVHHRNLHKIFGKSPLLSTAQKQERWVGIQREKSTNGIETTKPTKVVSKQPGKGESCPVRDSTERGIFSRLISQSNSFASLRTVGVSEPRDEHDSLWSK